MTLVASPFSWTNLFEYSPMGWGLLKLAVIMIVCSDIELSYILSLRCDPGRGLLQRTINTLLYLLLFLSFLPPLSTISSLYYPLSTPSTILLSLLSPISTISSLYHPLPLLSPLSTIPSLYYLLSLLSSLSTISTFYYLLYLLSPLSTIPSLYYLLHLLSTPYTISSIYYPPPST